MKQIALLILCMAVGYAGSQAIEYKRAVTPRYNLLDYATMQPIKSIPCIDSLYILDVSDNNGDYIRGYYITINEGL